MVRSFGAADGRAGLRSTIDDEEADEDDAAAAAACAPLFSRLTDMAADGSGGGGGRVGSDRVDVGWTVLARWIKKKQSRKIARERKSGQEKKKEQVTTKKLGACM